MPRQRLRPLISELHDELERTPEVDAGGRELLRELTDDIESVVNSDAEASLSPETAVERVESAALRLEAEHPRLAGILGEIVSALSRIGI